MTNTTNPYQSTAQSSQKFSTLAIVGFVLAFVINIAGLVVSLIALSQIKRTGGARPRPGDRRCHHLRPVARHRHLLVDRVLQRGREHEHRAGLLTTAIERREARGGTRHGPPVCPGTSGPCDHRATAA
ncbi:DUF4190 domain-containing protein [Curtobacterium sp. MCJR17_043]|uniref:DUF4190 domain-containing protein n=1 Tax=Curtobacterium sp. MCJR17_043 TaxID=2175660 RepID=UPI0024E00C54|nr:DUF4190 domain-containing protein [Curtobacterium sp. MCJR17_043]WIB35002.1 DUF4190 domain-containing protein [Curtobacterium sp. MCJR17_043]